MDRAPNELPERLAAVDLGSNSFHMIIARLVNAEPVIVDRIRDQVQLAAGLDERSKLSKDSRRRALACLERLGERLRGIPGPAVRAVGTNALRSARNAREFVREAEEALGHPIEIIAGTEEARLIYLGVAHSLADDLGRRLVLDIGGGSTECILGERFEAQCVESLFMGCITYTHRFFPDGRIARKAMQRAVLAAELELEPVGQRFREIGWADAVGASGTIRAAEEIIRANGWGEGIDRPSLELLRDEVVARGGVDRLDIQGLKTERAPVFAGGLAVLIALMKTFEVERLRTASGALREGVLYDLLGRVRHEDVRERTICFMQERFGVDRKHAARVEDTALRLLEAAGPDEAELAGGASFLGWAARLHEIGLVLSHRHYHRHGAYLIANSTMPGFSRDDQALLAILVSCHRRRFPRAELEALSNGHRAGAARLAVILRVAVVINRGRLPGPGPKVKASWKKSGLLKLTFPRGWLADHPLTEMGLEIEQAALSRSGPGLELTFRDADR